MNSIFEAIGNSSAKELEELATTIWLEFDLTFSENANTGISGEVASKGNVMEALLEEAQRKHGAMQ